MFSAYKIQALTALTTLCVLAIGAGALFAVDKVKQDGPVTILPADQTLLYIEYPDSDSINALGPFIPSLKQLSMNESVTSAALLRLPDNSTAWVTFSNTSAHDSDIHSENPEALKLLGGANLLGNDRTYRSLVRVKTIPLVPSVTRTWIYIKNPDTSLALSDAIRKSTHPIALSLTDSGIDIAWEDSEEMEALSNGMKPLFTHPVLSIQTNNLRKFMSSASNILAKGKVLAAQSRLERIFEEKFGSDVSMRYDLAPLLENETSFTIAQNEGDQSTVLLLEGSGPSDTEERIKALHRAAHAVSTVIKTERTFDGKFQFNNVRADTLSITDTVKKLGGWTQTVTAHSGTTLLVSAVNGRRFILSNDVSVAQQAISRTSDPIKKEAGAISAQGMMATGEASGLWNLILPGSPFPFADLLANKPIVRWNLVKKGNTALLRLF